MKKSMVIAKIKLKLENKTFLLVEDNQNHLVELQILIIKFFQYNIVSCIFPLCKK